MRNRGGGSWAVQWAITISVDKICPLENVRNERFGCTAPLAWPGQASLRLTVKHGLGKGFALDIPSAWGVASRRWSSGQGRNPASTAPVRDTLLLKLGAAKSQYASGWRLVKIEVSQRGELSFYLRKDKLREIRQRETRDLASQTAAQSSRTDASIRFRTTLGHSNARRPLPNH